MTPLYAALIVALLALPFHWAIRRELRRLATPEYLRARGVVIVARRAVRLEARVVGRYMDLPIPAGLSFRGMRYHFDHVIAQHEREAIRPGELYLEPGLVYRVD